MKNDTVLLYTFSPVQGFISEARRTADLRTGRQILVHLSRAIAEAIVKTGGSIIYPADVNGDAPNKLAALVSWENLTTIIQTIEQHFDTCWMEYCDQARAFLNQTEPKPDQTWNTIWDRQVCNHWQRYWSAAQMNEDHPTAYREAYIAAQNTLDARKRTREFAQSEEQGEKDTLSGRRQALTVGNKRSREYWSGLKHRNPGRILSSDLRTGGRERLDAIGAVKRFCTPARQTRFPSTSALAARSFTQLLQPDMVEYVQYTRCLSDLLGGLTEYEQGATWPYDGNLLYIDHLSPRVLEEDYELSLSGQGVEEQLKKARSLLEKLYSAVGERPIPYYAIIAMDGDNMGKRVNQLLKSNDPLNAHRQFSGCRAEFGKAAAHIIEVEHPGQSIYSGGDDVLALAPLKECISLALSLLSRFHAVTGATASAGIAIVHHSYPLDAAIQTAIGAEHAAKHIDPDVKHGLCVRMQKRSGETVQVYTYVPALMESETSFTDLVQLFSGRPSPLSGRLPYAVRQSSYALPEIDSSFAAELGLAIKRHSNGMLPPNLVNDLITWAGTFPHKFEPAEMLAQWLYLARFIAKGGAND